MIKLLFISDIYMPVAALIVYIINRSHIQKKERLIFYYLIFNIAVFSFTDWLAEKHANNLPLYHFDSVAELFIVSFYILKKITTKNFSPAFLLINGGYLVFFTLNVLFWEKLTDFNSNSASVTSIIILLLCMYYLLKLSKSDEILYFQRLPSFWITSGFLIYSAISLLVLLSYKYFLYVQMFDQGNNLWGLLSVAIIIKFALISIGLLCYRRRQTIHLPFLL